LLSLALVFAVVGLVCWLHPPPPPVVVLPIPEGWPSPRPTLTARLIAKVPMWVWRAKQSLFGPAKAIELDSAIFELRNWPASRLLALSLGKAVFTNSNGLQVWLIEDGELYALRRSLEIERGNKLISRPRVITANQVQANVSVGSTVSAPGTQGWCGVIMDFSPRVRGDSINLTTITIVSEVATNEVAAIPEGSGPPTNLVSIRTNLALAAKFHIPKGSGLFMLNNGRQANTGKTIGILISATQLQPKK
jgi:hypothetical protein